jgi:[protein-PII] uridylyltransferase
MNILEAKIYVRKDEIIIISVNIEETEILIGGNLETWKNLNQNLRDVFEGQKDLLILLAERIQYVSEKKLTEAIMPKVLVDNASDPNFSVVRIEASDHLGMLYKISKVFADFKIQIHSAKISTQGGRGIDVFYVSLKNKKLPFDKLVRRVKERIISAMLVENPEDFG